MKKTLFGFAIAVVATALVACGNKPAANAEGAETAAAEEQTEQATEEKAEAAKIDNKYFTADVPEGWELTRNSSDEFEVKLPKDGDLKKGFDAYLNYMGQSGRTVNDWMESRKTAKFVNKEDFEIDGVKFKVIADDRADNVHLYLMADKDGSRHVFETFASDYEKQPGVKQLLQSIKFK